jgi:hypothetical protein
MLLDAPLRGAVDVGGDEMTERRRHVVHLEDEVPGLQRGGRVVGQILAQLGQPPQYRQTYGQVLGEVGQRRVRHRDHQHLAGRDQLEGLRRQLFLGDLQQINRISFQLSVVKTDRGHIYHVSTTVTMTVRRVLVPGISPR